MTSLRREAFYPHPIGAVWTAITDPRALAEWLMPNNFKPVVGHKFFLMVDPGPGFSGKTECEVLECDPPRRLKYSWMIHASKPTKPHFQPMTVTWVLKPEGTGTRLTFEHEGLERIPFLMRLSMKFGWGTMHKRWLRQVMANIGPDGRFTPGARPLAKRCYKVKTLPPEIVR